MKESEISREVREFLAQLGASVYTLEQGYREGGTRQTPGLPDLYVVFEDIPAYTWAELKTAKGKLTAHQRLFRDMCMQAGIPWALWRDVRDAWDWCVSSGVVEEA